MIHKTTKYPTNELTEVMDAYASNYLTYSISEQLKKAYCLNIIRQQEREHKSQQQRFHIPFHVSNFAESDRHFLTMFNLEHTKLTPAQFEQLAQLLTQF